MKYVPKRLILYHPETVTRDDLPPPDCKRLTYIHKFVILVLLKRKEVAVEEVCQMYNLAPEGIEYWQKRYEQYGPHALKVNQGYQKRRSRMTAQERKTHQTGKRREAREQVERFDAQSI